jgi:alpha-amylase
MQQESQSHVYGLGSAVMETGDIELISDWRRLTISDHAYYMSTKYWNDGDVHAYFSPYSSPYDAFLYYMNALRDIKYRLLQHNERHKG